MQRKVVIDTCIYIEIFNNDQHSDQINWFRNISYLAYPVLHELLIGATNRSDVNSLLEWGEMFSKLNRIIIPTEATLFKIGQTCQKMRKKGKLDPVNPKHYNDITIALLARQIGATVVTLYKKDFQTIQSVVDVKCQFVKS
jgi:predicted nucleic acid-binding protein